MTQPPERLHAHGDPSPTHQVWDQIWLILFQRDLGNHTAGCASHTKAVPCIPVTFASTLCFHLCLPSSDTVLYMALLCGPHRLLPFLIIWLRLRVTIMTVTVLKEARLGGASNSLTLYFIRNRTKSRNSNWVSWLWSLLSFSLFLFFKNTNRRLISQEFLKATIK